MAKMKSRIIILVIGILLIATGIYLLATQKQVSNGNESNGTLCAQDVFECSDGSFVARNPDNNCEFYVCPAEGTFPEGTSPQTYEINIQSFAFSPKELTIQVGDTITWTNLDSSSHTITSDSGTELSSPNFGRNGVYSHTFNTVGTFAYHCALHPNMKGTITVE